MKLSPLISENGFFATFRPPKKSEVLFALLLPNKDFPSLFENKVFLPKRELEPWLVSLDSFLLVLLLSWLLDLFWSLSFSLLSGIPNKEVELSLFENNDWFVLIKFPNNDVWLLFSFFPSFSLLILKEKRLVSFLLSLSSLILSLFSSVTVLSFGNTNFFCSLTSILIFLLFDSFLTVVFLILSLVEILMVFSIIFISEFSTL